MIEQIRAVEQALGSAVKAPTPSELPVRALVRRSVTSRRDLAAGAVLTADDVCLLRPGTGIPPKSLEQALGRTMAHAVPAGTALAWSDLA